MSTSISDLDSSPLNDPPENDLLEDTPSTVPSTVLDTAASQSIDAQAAYYEALYDPDSSVNSSGARPPKRTKKRPDRDAIIAQLTESTEGLEGGFETTYQPARYEARWLYDSLRSFYDGALITDVVAQVKGGKEASVYCCRAHESLARVAGSEWVAAKVYRPRQFRNLRNDALYREGRLSLAADGKARRRPESRVDRALKKKSAFGQEVAHTSWLMYEYGTLAKLYAAGAAVPQPFAANENSILMSYIGEVGQAAPTLNGVALERNEAERLFRDVLHHIELLLAKGWVHGDLSAYNILYWRGEITLIDFPQVVDVINNANAAKIFRRDVQRVCDYFAAQGVHAPAPSIADALWAEYGRQPEEWAPALEE